VLEALEPRLAPSISVAHATPFTILDHARIQPIFYGSDWASGIAPEPSFIPVRLHDRANQLTKFLDDFVRSDYFSGATVPGSDLNHEKFIPGLDQYGIGNGAVVTRNGLYADFVNSDVSSLHGQITEQQIVDLITGQLFAGNVQATTETVYVVFTPPGLTVVQADGTKSNDPNHGFFGFHEANVTADPNEYYAIIPYPDSSNLGPINGLDAFQTLTEVASHEVAEAATDPDTTTGWRIDDSKLSNAQTSLRGDELGDLVNLQFGTAIYNGTAYTVQNLYSQALQDQNPSATSPLGIIPPTAETSGLSLSSGPASPYDGTFQVTQLFAPTEGVFRGLVATFADDRAANTDPSEYTATIYWGDGVASPGTISYNPTTALFEVRGSNGYVLPGGSAVKLQVIVLARGGATASDAATFTLQSHPPVFSHPSVGPFTIYEGQPLGLDLSATDRDGNALTYSLANGSPGYIQLQTGQYSWEPLSGQAGTYTVTVIAEDQFSSADAVSISFQVTVVSSRPRIGSFTCDKTAITTSGNDLITLTAKNVQTDFGIVDHVEFWRDNNGDGQVDAGDTDLGAGTYNSSTSSYTWSGYLAGLTQGTVTLLAQAVRYSFSSAFYSDPKQVALQVGAASFPPPLVSNTATLPQDGFVNYDRNGNASVVYVDSVTNVAYLRRYDPSGNLIGSPVSLPQVQQGASNSGSQILDVKALPDGHFIVLWAYNSVEAQEYNANGTSYGATYQVGSAQAGDEKVAISAPGEFAVVIADNGFYGDGLVKFYRYSQGSLVKSQVLSNFGESADLAMDATGNSVVGWLGSSGAVAQRIDSYGFPVGGTIMLSTQGDGVAVGYNPSLNLSLAVDEQGRFAAAWAGSTSGQGGIFARRFLADGTPVDTQEFRVNQSIAAGGISPLVAFRAGKIVTTWIEVDGTFPNQVVSVHGQAYAWDNTLRPLGGNFTVDNFTGFDSLAIDYQGASFVAGAHLFTGLNTTPLGFALRNPSLTGSLRLVPETLPSGTTVGMFQTPAAGKWNYYLVPGDGSNDNGQFQIVNGQLQIGANFDPGNQQHLLIRVRATPDVGLSIEQVFNFGVATFNTNGITTFNFGQLAPSQDIANAVTFEPDGKIVVVGTDHGPSFIQAALLRYNPDGSLDPSFGGTGSVTGRWYPFNSEANGVVAQPDGRIVVVGEGSQAGGTDLNLNMVVARYNPDGTLDAGFGSGGMAFVDFGGNDWAYRVALDSKGDIVVAGNGQASPGSNVIQLELVRLQPNGILDPSFGNGGKVTLSIGARLYQDTGLAIAPDGKIIASGDYYNGSRYASYVARFLPTGSPDTSLAGIGYQTYLFGSSYDGPADLALQPDGKMLIPGSFGLVRLNPDGTMDTSLNGTGLVSTSSGQSSVVSCTGAVVEPDGKILVSGIASNGSNLDFVWIRYTATGAVAAIKQQDIHGDDYATALALSPAGQVVVAGASGNSFPNMVLWSIDGNNAPTTRISGPSSAVPGQPVQLTIGAAEAAASTNTAGFTYQLSWGDGSSGQTFSGPGGLAIVHVYNKVGTYQVQVTAMDKHGLASDAATYPVSITTVAVEPEPSNPSETALMIGTQSAKDTVQIVPGNTSGTVAVLVNQVSEGQFAVNGSFDLYGVTKSVNLTVSPQIGLPTLVNGVVTSFGANPAQSTISVAPANSQSSAYTITLRARYADGRPQTRGGLKVSFGLAAGGSRGTFGPVTDNGDGGYSATFTPTAAVTDTFTATIAGQQVTSTLPTVTIPIGPTGTITTDRPVFLWTPTTGATSYDLRVNDVTMGRTGVVQISTVNVARVALTPATALSPGDSYTWYVGAVSSNGKVSWDSGHSFTLPPLAAPTPLSPGGTIDTARPTFAWVGDVEAARYRITLRDQTTGQQSSFTATNTTLALTASQALTPGHSYAWSVTAVSSNARTTVSSNGVSFSVAALTAPTLNAPDIGSGRPTLTWTPVTDAGNYAIKLKDANTGQMVVNIPHLVATSYTLTAAQALVPGHGYVWSVTAVSSNGQATGVLSALSFLVPILTAPTPTGPSGTITTDMPLFSWSPVPEAGHYIVSVKDSKTGQTVLSVGNLSQDQLVLKPSQALTPGHSYNWWVAAVSAGGQAKASSGSVNFFVSALVGPALDGPSGSVMSDQPTLTWFAIGGADHYTLKVQDQGTGQTLTIGNMVGTAYILSPSQALTPGDRYSWSVMAVSTNGRATASSGNMMFSIPALAPPVLIAPIGAITTGTPTFVWSAVANAGSYQLEVKDSKTSFFATAHTVGTSYTLTPGQALTPGHTYSWFVVALSTNHRARSLGSTAATITGATAAETTTEVRSTSLYTTTSAKYTPIDSANLSTSVTLRAPEKVRLDAEMALWATPGTNVGLEFLVDGRAPVAPRVFYPAADSSPTKVIDHEEYVTLTAGTHAVSVAWATPSGGTAHISYGGSGGTTASLSVSVPAIIPGVGPAERTTEVRSTSLYSTATANYTVIDVANLSTSVTLTASEKVRLDASMTLWAATGTNVGLEFLVDGSAAAAPRVFYPASGGSPTDLVNVEEYVELSAGTHTIAVAWATPFGGTAHISYGGSGGTTASLSVSVPAIIPGVGPAESTTEVRTTSLYSTSSTSYTPIDVSNLSSSVTLTAAETVRLEAAMSLWATVGTNVGLEFLVDGRAVAAPRIFYPAAGSVPTDVVDLEEYVTLTPGTHTVSVAWATPFGGTANISYSGAGGTTASLVVSIPTVLPEIAF
jgi:uncharacterized delta-60 repeat protein